MTLPRLYLAGPLQPGELVAATPDQARYLRTVLRMAPGDPLRVFTGGNEEYEARLRLRPPGEVLLEIGAPRPVAAPPAAAITLFQAVPKADKLDLVIRQATELGVGRIVPFFAERSVPRWPADKGRQKAERWRKIALEACRQCGRATVPRIDTALPFAEALRPPLPAALNLLFWEGERERGLRQALQAWGGTAIPSLSLLIGPEGGFEWGEVETALAAGFVSASLGRRVLRVDTAALAALAVLQYECGALDIPEGDGDAG